MNEAMIYYSIGFIAGCIVGILLYKGYIESKKNNHE